MIMVQRPLLQCLKEFYHLTRELDVVLELYLCRFSSYEIRPRMLRQNDIDINGLYQRTSGAFDVN